MVTSEPVAEQGSHSALARWGYEWAWSTPRSSEAVEIGAIFRLVPGLLQAQDPRGTIELRVRHDKESSGTASRTAALSPDHDRIRLSITGHAAFAELLLEGLVARDRREAAAIVAAQSNRRALALTARMVERQPSACVRPPRE